MRNRVQPIREARGLRREDLASKAGISYEYVRKLEVTGKYPSLDVARRVADVLGGSVDEIFPVQVGS